MTLSYLCEGQVTATVTAPDYTQVTENSGASSVYPLSITAGYTIGSQDGTYSGQGTAYYNGQDSGFGMGYYAPQSANKLVTPFVQLVRTYWSANIHPLASGSATFTVAALTSNGCTGTVRMESGMTLPTGAQVSWDNTFTTQDIDHFFGGGTAFNYIYAAQTSSTNSIAGTVTGGATIVSYPVGCSVVGPVSGSSYSATSTTQIAAN